MAAGTTAWFESAHIRYHIYADAEENKVLWWRKGDDLGSLFSIME